MSYGSAGLRGGGPGFGLVSVLVGGDKHGDRYGYSDSAGDGSVGAIARGRRRRPRQTDGIVDRERNCGSGSNGEGNGNSNGNSDGAEGKAER